MCNCLNRRDFLKVAGIGATSLGSLAAVPLASRSTAQFSPVNSHSPLKIKPVLLYQIFAREEATSWRPWGGIHTEADAETELARIGQELKKTAQEADFGVEILPPVKVCSLEQSQAAVAGNYDVLLVYAASGSTQWLETLAQAGGHPSIMFLRHKSGPVSLWYEITHPRFLRKGTDSYQEKSMGVQDVVVDDYEELLWKLRALNGLRNTFGTRIVAVGKAGGWGQASEYGPRNARDIWKMDIREVPYEELEPLVRQSIKDTKRVSEARKQTDEYLAQPGVSLHTDKQSLVNAFLLTGVFNDLMEREQATAFTINGCMSTIIPIAKTTACMCLSLINDDGRMAFCESDFGVIPSGVLLRNISGKPAFLQDPTHPHHGIVTIAHCTAPRRMNGRDLEPVEIHTHYESDFGAAPKVNMKKGQVVTNLCPSFTSEKWLGFRGTIIDHPFYDICRSQVDITIEGDWKRLLEDMQGFHWMTCYGDYLKEVGYALGKVGINWVDISNGSAV